MLNITPKPNGHNARAKTTPVRTLHELPTVVAESASFRVLPNGAKNPRAAKPAPAVPPKTFQTKVPVITGEAHYRGTVRVDGLLSGQMLAAGSSLNLRQKSRLSLVNEPELSGEINFNDMVRVNGHIAGTIYSQKGTLIVDMTARVDADVDVAVAVISGTVHGDIVARDRVEVECAAKIYGNIWTRSISIKDGAIFEGECRMIEVDGGEE